MSTHSTVSAALHDSVPERVAVVAGTPAQRRPIGRLLSDPRAVLIVASAYTLFLGTLSIVQHLGFRTTLPELGHADRSLWAITQGDWLMHVVYRPSGIPLSRLSIHANFIYWLLSPLYLIWPAPEQLLVLNTLACTAAGLGVYKLARLELRDSPWAAVAPMVFWASPMVHDANLAEFSPLVLSVPLVVWALWAFRVDRMRLGTLLVVLALSCQEEVALPVMALGAYLALSGKRRAGIVMACSALAYLVLTVGVVIPAFGEPSFPGLAGQQFGWLVRSGPAAIIQHVSGPDRIRVPLYLLLCGGVVAFRAWPILLLAVPQVVFAALNERIGPSRLTGTYWLMMPEAAVVLAVVVACARRPGTRQFRPLQYLAAATIVCSLLLSPLPHGLFSTWENYALSDERHALREIASLIPADARLCVQKNIGPHVGHRQHVIMHPRASCSMATHGLFQIRDVGGPDSGLFSRTDGTTLYEGPAEQLRETVLAFMASPRWGLILQRDGFYLFGRGTPSQVPFADSRRKFEGDSQNVSRTREDGEAVRWPLSRWLVGSTEWRTLASE